MPPARAGRRAGATIDVARGGPSIRCDCRVVLDAAEEVILRHGIGKLTLDAVARQASLSKSGLLHHFPSKEALVDALVQRKVQEWIDDTTEAYEATPPGRGRSVRSVLGTCLSSTEHWTDAMRRSSMVLVAALVHDPKHAEHLRKANAQMHERFGRDGIPVGIGELVHLAVHGIWFDWIFGLSDWTPQRLATVRAAIEDLLRRHIPSARRPESSGGARRAAQPLTKPAATKPPAKNSPTQKSPARKTSARTPAANRPTTRKQRP